MKVKKPKAKMTDARQLKQAICDIGLRMYERGVVAGNDGNISVRLTDSEVLCTPTGICKGRMTPDDLCVVDLSGNQLGGRRRRTSEILLHLAILKARPDVNAVVHSHAPHATAFAVTGQAVPRGVTAESEYFLGEIPIAPYETPGTQTFAETVLPYVDRSNVCLLAQHGVVTFAESLDQAYSLTEVLDAYCQTIILAQQIGTPQTLPDDKMQELHALRLRDGTLSPKHPERES